MSYYPQYQSPYSQQYPQQYPQYPQFQTQFQSPLTASQPTRGQNQGICWVQGEAGAKSYHVEPGQSELLMDSEKSCFYIKSTDISGMPLPLRIFDYVERNSVPASTPEKTPANAIDFEKFVTKQEFEEKISALMEGINNAKSDL
jgi:hypothetical protein